MLNYTDIARECVTGKMETNENRLDFGCFESIVKIDSVKKEKFYGKAKGEYYLLDCPNLHSLAPIVYEYVTQQVASYLSYKIKKMTNKQNYKALVVCLGNENIVSDSLGASVFAKLTTTPLTENFENETHKSLSNLASKEVKNFEKVKNGKRHKNNFAMYDSQLGHMGKIYNGRLSERDRKIINAYESGDSLDDLCKRLHLHSNNLNSTKYDASANGFNKSQNVLQAIKTSVLGKTGIDTARLIKGIKNTVEPDVVILIDSLCSTSLSRIGSSFQISDSGIVAGGAIGRQGEMINASFLKCPTLVIGIPFVVRVETIVNEVLSSMSDDSINENREFSTKYNNLLVSPKDIDLMVELGSYIVASAINLAVLDLSINEQRMLSL